MEGKVEYTPSTTSTTSIFGKWGAQMENCALVDI